MAEWFSDINMDETGRYRWQPYIQFDGYCLTLPIWFETEEKCDAWIKTNIINTTHLFLS